MRLKSEYTPSGVDSDCFQRLTKMFSRQVQKIPLASNCPFTTFIIARKINTTYAFFHKYPNKKHRGIRCKIYCYHPCTNTFKCSISTQSQQKENCGLHKQSTRISVTYHRIAQNSNFYVLLIKPQSDLTPIPHRNTITDRLSNHPFLPKSRKCIKITFFQ